MCPYDIIHSWIPKLDSTITDNTEDEKNKDRELLQ